MFTPLERIAFTVVSVLAVVVIVMDTLVWRPF